jgi:hypothetical protein
MSNSQSNTITQRKKHSTEKLTNVKARQPSWQSVMEDAHAALRHCTATSTGNQQSIRAVQAKIEKGEQFPSM